jgi:hypothetical protein
MFKETILLVAGAVILLEFSEYCLFLCLDDIKGFQWETDQAILRPFVVYYCLPGPENSIKEMRVHFCAIHDCLEHTATTFHSYLTCIMAPLGFRCFTALQVQSMRTVKTA